MRQKHRQPRLAESAGQIGVEGVGVHRVSTIAE